MRERDLVATVRSTGGWLDHALRQLVAPPAELLAAFAQMPRSAEFRELPSIARSSGEGAATAE